MPQFLVAPVAAARGCSQFLSWQSKSSLPQNPESVSLTTVCALQADRDVTAAERRRLREQRQGLDADIKEQSSQSAVAQQRLRCGTSHHRLSSEKMTLITSNCGATRSLSIE